MTTVPHVRVNNYIKIENTPLDVLSKIFIIFEFLLGVNRLTVIGVHRVFFIIMTCLYSVSVIGLVSYITFVAIVNPFLTYVKLTQYAIYTIFGFATRRKLREFYKELQNFDKEFGSKPKIIRGCLKIVLQVFFLASSAFFFPIDKTIYVVIYLIHLLENQYYGYLLHLLIQRLRSINLCIKISLLSTEIEKSTEVENGNEIIMSKLMDFYYIIVNAYDLLTDVIKYQVKILNGFQWSSNSIKFTIRLDNLGSSCTNWITIQSFVVYYCGGDVK